MFLPQCSAVINIHKVGRNPVDVQRSRAWEKHGYCRLLTGNCSFFGKKSNRVIAVKKIVSTLK